MAAMLNIATPLQVEQVRALELGTANLPSRWQVAVAAQAIGSFRVEVLGPGYRAAQTFEYECSAAVLSAYLKLVQRYAGP
jgi:hypothetical protein